MHLKYIYFIVGLTLLLFVQPNTRWILGQHNKLEAVKSSKELRIGIVKSANHYFVIGEQETGLEYDLLVRFARYLKAKEKIIIFDDVPSLKRALLSGDIDIMTASQWKYGKSSNIYYSNFFITQKLLVVNFNGGVLAKNNSVFVRSEHKSYLHKHKKDTFLQKLNVIDTDKSIVDVVSTIKKNKQAMLIDAFEYSIYRLLNPQLKVVHTLSGSLKYRMGMLYSSGRTLLWQANNFILRMKRQKYIEKLVRRYYAYNQMFNVHNADAFLNKIASDLPKYQDTFNEAAEKYNLDANLLAAMAYQESRWEPKAVSFTGVKGIMMLTKITAKEMQIKNRLDATQSIFGGAKYLKLMLKRVPKSISFPDRLWFAVAAYNIGIGHIADARRITASSGLDSKNWDNVVKYLPKLRNKNWYMKENVHYGYARGDEAVQYVRNIRRFYDVLRYKNNYGDLPN